LTGDPIIGQLLLQLVLILVNAFFAATEIALLSLNENRLEKSVEDGDRKAALLLKTVRSPDSFLSAIQVGITLAGFLGSAFAAENFADRLVEWLINDMHVAISAETLGAISVVLITIVLSYFTLVLGELVPKRVAMFAPDKVARFSIGVISAIEKVLRPVIWLMSKSTNAVLRLMRVDPHKETEEVTEEEIRIMVDIGEEKGAIESAEKEMIENVFEFNNTTAGDVMTHRIDVKSIQADADGDDIIELIAQTGLSRFPGVSGRCR
jgi:putative hemolysin